MNEIFSIYSYSIQQQRQAKQQHKATIMDSIEEQMDDVLGNVFSKLDYYVKYEIMYGYMPLRYDYIDELKSIYHTIKNTLRRTGLGYYCPVIKKSECPLFLQQSDSTFIIDGIRYDYQYTAIQHLQRFNSSGDIENGDPDKCVDNGNSITFYKFVHINQTEVSEKEMENATSSSPNGRRGKGLHHKRSSKFYYESGAFDPYQKLSMLTECKDIIKRVKTCRECKSMFADMGITPSKKITGKTLKEMTWEIVKQYPEKYMKDPRSKRWSEINIKGSTWCY